MSRKLAEDRNTHAVVFVVSRNSSYDYRRVLWCMTKVDAMKVCSDQRTSNQHHMLCFTTKDIDDPKLNRYMVDDGRCSGVLRDHDITVLQQRGNGQKRGNYER